MNGGTLTRLLDLNKQFYQTFGREFSSTRQRLDGPLAFAGAAMPAGADHQRVSRKRPC